MTTGKLVQRAVKISKILMITCLFQVISQKTVAQIDNFKFKKLISENANQDIPFAIPNTGNIQSIIREKDVRVKAVTKEWIYIQTTPTWIESAVKSNKIESFYLEFPSGMLLNDSAAFKHYVRPVQQGLGGLQVPFTGKDVVVGFVDQGLDYNHPDFKKANGETRVLYYWDHTLGFDPIRTPQPYGYGQVWNSTDIQSGNCGSIEDNGGHGSTVTGTGVGNGLANGKEKGMAPDAKIIVVETNFNLPNWTLTVADACDFIFHKADELGLPAVVNLSVGSYLGSHDATDPAAVLMDVLLDEKPGRIIVCAAGNSGAWGKYHVGGVVDADTSFVWVKPNPNSQLGSNAVYLDLWTDLTDANWNYSWGANLSTGSFEERAALPFRAANSGIGTTIKDTLWNGTNRIATIEIYPEIVGPNLHLEFYFTSVDSSSYLYSFKTTGSGKYDAWSGSESIALNNMITENLPSIATYPPIQHYHLPDSLMTLVSSWSCSPKVVTVGNTRNRQTHIDKNGNPYVSGPTNNPPPGKLVPASAKGPTRHGLIKPNIVASGDVTLSAAPLFILNDPGYNGAISEDGWHGRNGGTSMASPIVAGIAALYLEKCSKGTFQSFIDAVQSTAYTDLFTGSVPNNAYGYGKIHALDLMLQSNFGNTLTANTSFCPGDSALSTASTSNYSIEWMNGQTSNNIALTNSGDIYFKAFDTFGCVSYSDTISATVLSAPPAPVIQVNGMVLSTDPYPSLQWYENGTPIAGANQTSYTITLPTSSIFTVSRTSTDGCEIFSLPYNPSLGIFEESLGEIQLYPNPTTNLIYIQSPIEITQVQVIDVQGREVMKTVGNAKQIEVSELQKGTYYVIIQTEKEYFQSKIVKN